jgi:hypothetical protein
LQSLQFSQIILQLRMREEYQVKETALSKKQKSNQSTIDGLAQKLVKLVGMFRKSGPASDYQWWGRETPHTVYKTYPGYQGGHQLFDTVVAGVLQLNPDMLSKHEVEWKLTYEFLKQEASYPNKLSGEELMDKARNRINELVEFEAWQDIDYPIMNLWLEGELVELGHVTFMPATEQDVKQWQKDYGARHQGIADMHVFARVNAPGDLQKAVSYARTQVNSALDMLRMLSFPFYPFSDACRIGVLGEIGSSTFAPIRINQRQFAAEWTGTGVGQPELRKHIFSKLEQHQWELINKLMLKAEHSRSDMENKLLDGIHWLGESTKPDTNHAGFVKLGVALEALIGGEPKKDEMLQVRGITAMLAERAAFVAGEDQGDRVKIDKDIRKYYGMRSKIVHGVKINIKLRAIDNFGMLVRRVALALLEKLDELGDKLRTVDQLESWVKTQRYTLPQQS